MGSRADLVVRDLTVELGSGVVAVRPLDGFSLQGSDGELIVVRGRSGGGKTTLLSVLAGLLTPSRGHITFGGTALELHSRHAMVHHRRHTVGMVFQSFNLVPSLTALENVMAPMVMTGSPWRAAARRAAALLAEMDLADRHQHRPGRLSGGQQQRVALARSLVHDPPLLLADEPTAHLDRSHATVVIDLLRRVARPGRLVVVTTHDDRVAERGDAVVELGR